MTSPLEKLWIGKATIYEYFPTTNSQTFQTTYTLQAVASNQPCRLSYDTDVVTNINSGLATVSQIITLFISPNLDIKAGSVIEVTQHGRTNRYKRGSKPAIYTDHQEVTLQYEEDVDNES